MASASKILTGDPSQLDYFLFPIKNAVYAVEGTTVTV